MQPFCKSRRERLLRHKFYFAGKARRLKVNPISIKERIELVEGQTRWTSGADQEEIAFSKTRLNGRGVERLQ
jgi:hypothetical protein